jgi:hypothetical protein
MAIPSILSRPGDFYGFVGVQSEALLGQAIFTGSLEFKAKLCSDRRFLRVRWSSKRSFARTGDFYGFVGVLRYALLGQAIFTGSLEFKAKLCSAKQSFALNSKFLKAS